MTRLLAIMGSGETSPTMVKIHRAIFERVGGGEGALLDTPFGFQENADDICARAIEYFRTSVGCPMTVASFRGADQHTSADYARTEAALREAALIFSGPGSPSFALRTWHGTTVPHVLRDKLRTRGAVVFASAAALTLGRLTVPVYEVYKVGEPPRWLEGLDLLAEAGLSAAVVPHYDNSEGGNHDTRYCYMGERRLRILEDQLPEGTFIFGVDEHTAALIDLDRATVTVEGRGGITIRRQGRSSRFEAGTEMPIQGLVGAEGTALPPTLPPPEPDALEEGIDDIGRRFAEALDEGDAGEAVEAVLQFDQTLVDWSRDTTQSDALDRARGALRAMIVRLGDAACEGVRDRREVVGPFVQAVVDAREDARSRRDFAAADQLRDRLVALGVEVRDSAAGTEWDLSS